MDKGPIREPLFYTTLLLQSCDLFNKREGTDDGASINILLVKAMYMHIYIFNVSLSFPYTSSVLTDSTTVVRTTKVSTKYLKYYTVRGVSSNVT